MSTRFADRIHAGQLLAEQLADCAGRDDIVVLALSRGGVPVAAEVARKLRVPLDVFTVRKLGLPGYPELAMGAIATGGVRVLNREVVDALGVPERVLNAVVAKEQIELPRRERAYRDDLPPPDVRDKVVIVVDDGVATGSTMAAAIAALRKLGAYQIIAATPIIAQPTLQALGEIADGVAWMISPDNFAGVGAFYEDFSQTSDEEVRAILAARSTLTGATR